MVFWPIGASGGTLGWLRIVDGHAVQRGEGEDWQSATHLTSLPPGETAMLIVPTGNVALHWISCPGMPVRQGAAAAPLMAFESSIGRPEALHAAIRPAAHPAQPHVVAVAAREDMDRWLAKCESAGVPEAAIVPAAMLLPAPESGFVEARIGTENVLRGVDSAFGAHEAHAEMIVNGETVSKLSVGDVERLVVAGLAHPPLDLRQGAYARRRRSAIDPNWAKRMLVLAGCIIGASVLISAVTVTRLYLEARALDARTMALARPIVPAATDPADADARLSALLAARGGGRGFVATAAGVMVAMRATPGVHISNLSQMADGSVRLQLLAPRAEDINQVLIAMQNAGWRIAADGVQQQAGQIVADITVVPS